MTALPFSFSRLDVSPHQAQACHPSPAPFAGERSALLFPAALPQLLHYNLLCNHSNPGGSLVPKSPRLSPLSGALSIRLRETLFSSASPLSLHSPLLFPTILRPGLVPHRHWSRRRKAPHRRFRFRSSPGLRQVPCWPLHRCGPRRPRLLWRPRSRQPQLLSSERPLPAR